VVRTRGIKPCIWRRVAIVFPVALGLLPVVLTFVGSLGLSWFPVGDDAATLVRLADVGSSDSPLVGSYSTHGWAHPGPALFWLLAMPYRVSGGSLASVLWGTVLIHGLGVAALAWVS